MSVIYYVVILDGVPRDVTTIFSRAVTTAKELSTATKEASIVPCIPRHEPVQMELDFSSEEPTEPMVNGPKV